MLLFSLSLLLFSVFCCFLYRCCCLLCCCCFFIAVVVSLSFWGFVDLVDFSQKIKAPAPGKSISA